MTDWGDWELYNVVCVSDDEPEDFEEEIWDDAWTEWAESVSILEVVAPAEGGYIIQYPRG